MFYHQPYEKEKAKELLKSVENIYTEVCYKDDPIKPFLCPVEDVITFQYHQYPLEDDLHA
ncbi:uncharacterized protein EV154DRAFT_511830 [Mucor mucedo]|uniref:uncharacterized protein n=1 Tax=Mucor mucedo TaxID=29922 RepID=UPI002220C53C|nr:uncharacterized protein EV154DRAFT_511830 [Mucor mucedo]KAI7890349.1 hypothetical protein EV154DRAFT_511830 [Mucor mucedo]